MPTLHFVRFQHTFNQPPFAPILTAKTAFDAIDATTFFWTFQDPNPADAQSGYQLQIQRISDGVNVVDTGHVDSLAATPDTDGTNESHTISGGTLDNSVAYRWRVRTWDSEGEQGPYSAYSTFSPTAGATVSITAPEDEDVFDVADFMVEWDYTHPDSEPQDEYRVRVMREDNLTVVYTSDWVSSSATQHMVTDVPSSTVTDYIVEVQAKTNSIESNADVITITVEYETPDEPELTIDAFEGYLRVSVVNPLPTGDRPVVFINHLFRRRQGDDEFIRISTNLENNGEYRDYTVASGVTYEYFAQARTQEDM